MSLLFTLPLLLLLLVLPVLLTVVLMALLLLLLTYTLIADVHMTAACGTIINDAIETGCNSEVYTALCRECTSRQ
jgi:hypothetical protein